MPLKEYKRGLLVIGVTLLLAAPGLAVGSLWSRQQHIAEFQDAALSPETLADSAIRESVRYHLSRLQADQAMRWSSTGDATLGVVGGVAGLILIVWSRRRSNTIAA